LVAFGETSISACDDSIPRKQLLRWVTRQTPTGANAQLKQNKNAPTFRPGKDWPPPGSRTRITSRPINRFFFKHNAVKHTPQCNQVSVPKSLPVL